MLWLLGPRRASSIRHLDEGEAPQRGQAYSTCTRHDKIPLLLPLINGRVLYYTTYISMFEQGTGSLKVKKAAKNMIEEERKTDELKALMDDGKADLIYDLTLDWATTKRIAEAALQQMGRKLHRLREVCGHCYVQFPSITRGARIIETDAILCGDCTFHHCNSAMTGMSSDMYAEDFNANIGLEVSDMAGTGIDITIQGSALAPETFIKVTSFVHDEKY